MILKIKSNWSKVAPWLKISYAHKKTKLKSLDNFRVTKDWVPEGNECNYFKQTGKFESMQKESVDYVSYLWHGWNSSVGEIASGNVMR